MLSIIENSRWVNCTRPSERPQLLRALAWRRMNQTAMTSRLENFLRHSSRGSSTEDGHKLASGCCRDQPVLGTNLFWAGSAQRGWAVACLASVPSQCFAHCPSQETAPGSRREAAVAVVRSKSPPGPEMIRINLYQSTRKVQA